MTQENQPTNVPETQPATMPADNPSLPSLTEVAAGNGSSELLSPPPLPAEQPVVVPQALIEAVTPTTTMPPTQIPAGVCEPSGRRYGFLCVHCSSRLEATDLLGGQMGNCPTCGKQTVIPYLDNRGRLIDPFTGEIIKQDPLPMHAYAAAGERAPKIKWKTSGDGSTQQVIECPRCQLHNPISGEFCRACGLPFTMEATKPSFSTGANGYGIAALVLGILGVFFSFCTLGIVPILALIFGILAVRQVPTDPQTGTSKGMGIAGIILGTLGILIAGFALIMAIIHP